MNDQLLKPGFAWFDIIQADDTRQDGSPLISKNGALMLKLTLNCTDTQGNTLRVYDYIIEGIEWKILSLQKSINTEDPILVIPNDGKKSPYWDKPRGSNGTGSSKTPISQRSSHKRSGDDAAVPLVRPAKSPAKRLHPVPPVRGELAERGDALPGLPVERPPLGANQKCPHGERNAAYCRAIGGEC